MAILALTPTATRTYALTKLDDATPLIGVNRRGLASPTYNFQLWQRLLEGGNPAMLSTLVGVWATSKDFRQGLRLIQRTSNFEGRDFGGVRFDLAPLRTVAPQAIVSAVLTGRLRPLIINDETVRNSDQGCDRNPILEARPLTVPLPDIRPANNALEHPWPVVPDVVGLPLSDSAVAVDVLPLVRHWRLVSPLEGNVLLRPRFPRLHRLTGTALGPNARRRRHWVREDRWRIDDDHYAFTCRRLIGHLQILVRTND